MCPCASLLLLLAPNLKTVRGRKRGVGACMARWALKDNFPKFGGGRLNDYGHLDDVLLYYSI